jgi:Rad3-related DNA helicase
MELNINNIKDTFFSILDDYKKYYIFTNKNPEVDEYQNYYLDAKNQLLDLSNKLLNMSKNIENNILELNKKNKLLIKKLNEEKEENEELNELLRSLKSTENGSKELINNTKELYNNQYYQNIELFFGILIVSSFLIKLRY